MRLCEHPDFQDILIVTALLNRSADRPGRHRY